MKLKTKFQDEDFELGEVTDIDITTMPDGCFKAQARTMRGGLRTFYYDTKADFDAAFEDAPKELKHDYYFIRDGGNIDCHWYQKLGEITERRKAIGNYFETEEEAEKAAEKFKAFNRLKENGFKFTEWGVGFDNNLVIKAKYTRGQIYEDMNLLFGDEE